MQQTFSVYSRLHFQYIILIIFFFFSTTIKAQTKLKWGEIPEAQLAMEQCSFEEDAKALILADIGSVNIENNYSGGLNVKLKRHKRIKIFDKSASDQGDIKLRYYHKYTINNLKAQVVAKDGRVTELSKKQIFDEKVNRYYKSKNFALPNVQPGSVLEIKYTMDSPYISELFEWYFQEKIPVMHSELSVEIPAEFEYIFLFQGAESPKQTDSSKRTYFTMNEVPSLQEEAFITSMDNYRNRIRFQLVKYTPSANSQALGSQTAFSSTPMSDWEELSEQLIENQNFGNKLRVKRKKINDNYLSSVQGVEQMNDLEKAKSIYKFVQSKMTWNGFIGIYTDNKLDKVLDSGSGMVQEINMILTILLNANGIESNMVIMPARTSGKPLETIPFVDQFDYAISSAKIGEDLIFIDASGDMNPMGIMPVRALTSRGFMISKKEGKWVDIPIIQDKEVTYFKGAIDTDGSVIGTWSKRLNAYSSAEAKKKYSLRGEEYVITNLKDKFSDLDITNTKLEGLMAETMDVKYSVDISIPGACTVANDYLYLKPVMHTSFDENPFKMEERKYPIDMPYPFVEQFILALEIPDGLKVEEIPEEVNFVLPNRDGSFTYSAKVIGDNIMIDSKLNFKRRSYNPEEYQGVKELFEKVISKHNEQIVFKMK